MNISYTQEETIEAYDVILFYEQATFVSLSLSLSIFSILSL